MPRRLSSVLWGRPSGLAGPGFPACPPGCARRFAPMEPERLARRLIELPMKTLLPFFLAAGLVERSHPAGHHRRVEKGRGLFRRCPQREGLAGVRSAGFRNGSLLLPQRGKYSISAFRFGDATGAFAAFDEARPAGARPIDVSGLGAANASDEDRRRRQLPVYFQWIQAKT